MKLIYEPAGRAREYASLAANLYTSCTHGCLYCYAPRCLQRKRDLFHTAASVRKNALNLFATDCAEYTKEQLTEPVLMSFISDPYQPDELELRITRSALEIAASYKVTMHILTKGGTRAVPDFPILAATGEQAAFACTLTVCDKSWAAKLEPHAAEPLDRLNALKAAHEAGITTWVSFEPSIDEQSVIKFIRTTYPYVDLYKVGAISGDKTISTISNWREYGLNVINELVKYEKKYIVKNDLKKELITDGDEK
jgi:DNA repair photolyase